MDKEVMLTIRGLHMGGETQAGDLETRVRAEYFKKGESHYLLFEERQEGFAEPVRSRIKYRNKVLEITRRGLIETHMVFDEGRRCDAAYRIPYGEVNLGIEAREIALEEKPDTLRITAAYDLEIDGEPQAHSVIEILAVQTRS